jgi:tight adherence protein B
MAAMNLPVTTSAGQQFSRDDAAQLCGRVAALSRAGLPASRVWQVLAASRGPSAQVAEVVAGMIAVGGSTAEGLQLAAEQVNGPGAQALTWLAVTASVVERSGAPAALVFDGVSEGLLAQIAQADEREVALAGPRTTAVVLTSLPLIGVLLGAAIGVNTISVLLGTPAGWGCSLCGGLFWAGGRYWSSRLVRSASQVET